MIEGEDNLAGAASKRSLGGGLMGIGVFLVAGGGGLLVFAGPLGILVALVGVVLLGAGLSFRRDADNALRM